MGAEKEIDNLHTKYDKLECNQQAILQTLNNGLKSKSLETMEKVEKLEDRFNKLLLALGAGMFTIIIMFAQIIIKLR